MVQAYEMLMERENYPYYLITDETYYEWCNNLATCSKSKRFKATLRNGKGENVAVRFENGTFMSKGGALVLPALLLQSLVQSGTLDVSTWSDDGVQKLVDDLRARECCEFFDPRRARDAYW